MADSLTVLLTKLQVFWTLQKETGMNRSRRWTTVLILVTVSALTAAPGYCQEAKTPDVIFVPTEQPVVEEMLSMAQVSKNSVVYDLGCGDGRIVITAAAHYGARGVGIDIDPERIRESQQNARAAGVSSRVKFIRGDLFQTDFHEATVVMLYLSSAVNVRLRPILLRQLKPGTPVVSHDFLMGDWQPDDTNSVNGAAILLWIVPARVAGVWQWTVNKGAIADRYELTIRQEFQKLTGTLAVNGKEEELTALKLVGDRMEFESAQRRFSGQVAAGTMNGLLSEANHDYAWTATRSEAMAGSPIE
jgi:SAM-dependent methyltransferase